MTQTRCPPRLRGALPSTALLRFVGGQEHIFDTVGKPMTDTCMDGYNGAWFARCLYIGNVKAATSVRDF